MKAHQLNELTTKIVDSERFAATAFKVVITDGYYYWYEDAGTMDEAELIQAKVAKANQLKETEDFKTSLETEWQQFLGSSQQFQLIHPRGFAFSKLMRSTSAELQAAA